MELIQNKLKHNFSNKTFVTLFKDLQKIDIINTYKTKHKIFQNKKYDDYF